MTLRKGVLILALFAASEFMFVGCSDQVRNELDLQTEEKLQKEETEKNLISEYDPIMKQQAKEHGLDWRFLSAIGYHESRFMNDVVSPVGAIGVMQVMPSVARSFGVSIEAVKNPEVNIETAVRIIKTIESSMRFPRNISSEDKLRIILACYNGGIGHVMDAYRLAAKNGANQNRWNDLERYLKLKSSPQFINDPAVKCGRFNSSETVNFVKVVMEQYQDYCRKYPA